MPGWRVFPPSSTGIAWVGPAPAAVVYAVVRSFLAPWVTASAAWLVPFRVTVLNPEIAGVGNVPILPLRVVFPVLVIPAPASTTKLLAVPSGTGAVAAWALPGIANSRPRAAIDAMPKRARPRFDLYGDSFIFDPFDCDPQ